VTVSKNVIKAVTPAKPGVQKSLYFLDSGPFDKLRVPSLPRDFRRNDASLRFLALCKLMNTKVLEDL
jgi:hypothetical protein